MFSNYRHVNLSTTDIDNRFWMSSVGSLQTHLACLLLPLSRLSFAQGYSDDISTLVKLRASFGQPGGPRSSRSAPVIMTMLAELFCMVGRRCMNGSSSSRRTRSQSKSPTRSCGVRRRIPIQAGVRLLSPFSSSGPFMLYFPAWRTKWDAQRNSVYPRGLKEAFGCNMT
jgi:hypothetical protein